MNLIATTKRTFKKRSLRNVLAYAKKDIFQTDLHFEDIVEKYVSDKIGDKRLFAFCMLEVASDRTSNYLHDQQSKVFQKYEEQLAKVDETRSLLHIVGIQEITTKIAFMLTKLDIQKEHIATSEKLL